MVEKVLGKIIFITIVLTILYLLLAFCHWDLNTREWVMVKSEHYEGLGKYSYTYNHVVLRIYIVLIILICSIVDTPKQIKNLLK